MLNTKKFILTYLLSFFILWLIVEKTRDLFFYDNNFIFVIIGAISFYLIFNNLKMNYNFSRLEKYTFNIYLVHPGILSVVSLFLNKILIYEPNPSWYIPFMIFFTFLNKILIYEPNPSWYIPFMIFFTFITSYTFSIFLERVKLIISKKYTIK